MGEKKSDRNCLSKNHDDCLVWCLVEVPEEVIDLYVVTDTFKIKEFEVISLYRSVMVKAGGFTEWKEILCAADVSPRLYESIQLVLYNAGYDVEVISIVGVKTKAALVKF